MSTNNNIIDQDNISVKSYKNCCKFKYKIRWFNSKGVGLILVWTMLVSASLCYNYQYNKSLLSGLTTVKFNKKLNWILTFVEIILCLVSIIILGWLADRKLGQYKVFKTGFIFLFIASVLASVLMLVLENLPANSIVAPVASGLVAPFIYFFVSIGGAACLITAVQLGIHQMPDASVDNITSYISWFVFCVIAGSWTTDISYYVHSQTCLHSESFSNSSNCTIFRQTFSLFPVVCMTVVLCLDFFFAKKWLIKEKKSIQSLRLIFRVLKFAIKHKAPINRSAFTYWEEDIPSRIDLGKLRYGGPFTTEQVEDVKTIFKLMAISLPCSIVLVSMILLGIESYNINRPGYDTSLWSYFTYNRNWSILIGTLVYEFAIYPLLKNKLPSLLKRFGVLSFIIIALSITSLSLSVAEHFHSTLNANYIWNHVILQVLVGFLTMFSVSILFEFVCAQSPYHIRTIAMGCATIIIISTITVGNLLLTTLLNKILLRQYYSIAHYAVATGLSIVGFVIYCLIARWYKGRVRDDICTTQKLVEEVYERYRSHQTEDYN